MYGQLCGREKSKSETNTTEDGYRAFCKMSSIDLNSRPWPIRQDRTFTSDKLGYCSDEEV